MAFWKKIYKSKYTGAEIDAAVAKAGDATKVTANPTLAGTESALTGLEVGTTKYKVGGDEIVFVHISSNDQEELIADKTYNEIVALIESGKIVCASYNNRACTLLINTSQAISFLTPIDNFDPEDHIIEQSIIAISNLDAVTVAYVSTVVTSITIES